MLSEFFIRRPVFAAVISILIMLAGAAAYFELPVSRYPDITPPTVRVTANYPGANAETVASSVAAPIEQQVNGVDNMIYMSSTSASDGSYSLDISFKVGTNVDMATVLVQNRVNAAMAQLPDDVKRLGLNTTKQSTELIKVIAVSSPDKRYDDLFLSNFVTLNLKDELLRISGVGAVAVYPSKDYGMRIWMDPDKLSARKMTANDVLAAISEQNVQVAAGVIGQPPAPVGQNFQYTVTTLGRLSSPTDFENIILKTTEEGGQLRLKDVARVELGGDNYTNLGSYNGQPSAILLTYLSPGANAVEVAQAIDKKMDELRKRFPEGLEAKVTYDASIFVVSSIHEVYKTLYEAVILVVLTVLLFLHNWRATLIPSVTIPVALVGTFAAMQAMGFSINMLTLFGLVLAIGIVVDDAIVVVENVERNMKEKHLPPLEASIVAMREVFAPIIAISLVLMAVFVPSAMQGGISGELSKQFALTIAVTTLFSAINALTLSPALCALILKGDHGNATPNRFVQLFDKYFGALVSGYSRAVEWTLRHSFKAMILFILTVGAGIYLMANTPRGFLPPEDQGVVLADVQLPDGASLQRTEAMVNKAVAEILKIEGVSDISALPGFSMINGAASNAGLLIITLEPWDERIPEGRNLRAIIGEIRSRMSHLQDGVVFPFNLPAIPGLGQASGFELRVLDQGNLGAVGLGAGVDELMSAATSQSALSGMNTGFRVGAPQLYLDIDREKVKRMGVKLDDVFKTLQGQLGSSYVNDFNIYGRTYRVRIQAESAYRSKADDIARLEVRNQQGDMIPLGALLTVNDSYGADKVQRFNMYRSASVNGQGAPGVSSGDAMDLVEQMANTQLPSSMGIAWYGMSYQEKLSSGGVAVFAAGMLVVYLILAALYESWVVPLAVILPIPLALCGAMGTLSALGLDNNLYTQVGITLLIALAAKNAILIVEFARELAAQGMSLYDAVLTSARQRFRPILMTSLAFVLGTYPLVAASGAGAASLKSVGITVFSGMIGATILGVLFIPVVYYTVETARRRFLNQEGAAISQAP